MIRISLPSKSGSKGAERVTDRYDGTWDELKEYEISYGKEHEDFPNFYLSDHDLTPDITGKRGVLSLIYTNSGGDAGTVDSNKAVYTCSMGQIDKPIETKSGYVCNWNYNLFYKVTEDNNFPDEDTIKNMTGWTNATVPCAWTATDDSYDFKWSKDNSDFICENTDGTRNTYTMCVGKTMPGVESYLLFAPCVHETKFYLSEKKASTALKDVGKISTPTKTFGYSGGSWLVISGECTYEKNRWVVRKSYQNADSWNTKLYSAAT